MDIHALALLKYSEHREQVRADKSYEAAPEFSLKIARGLTRILRHLRVGAIFGAARKQLRLSANER